MPQTPLSFQELPALRKRTEAISQYLQQRLTAYLEVIKPLLAPERFLGKHVGGKGDGISSDKALAQITQAYQGLVGKPFDLPRTFEPEWLLKTGTRIELHRMEYLHPIPDAGAEKTIRMTSPVRWIMTCGSVLTPFQALQIHAGRERSQTDNLRQFVVDALAMQLVLSRNPGLDALFADLRFALGVEFLPETGQLPFVTVTSSLPSFRPADDLILAATEFSGVPAFIELIDIEAIPTLQDPLKQHIEGLLA